MIFINMKNYFTVSMFWSDNVALTSISLINIDTPRDIDGFNVLECTKVILLLWGLNLGPKSNKYEVLVQEAQKQ